MTAPTSEGVSGGWGIRDRGRALSVQVRTVPEFTKAPIFKNLILIKKSAMELFSTDLSTTERIAVGVLSLIALIVYLLVYLRWRGPVATIARQKITAARHPVVETLADLPDVPTMAELG